MGKEKPSNFLSPEQVVSQMLEEFFMPASMGKPRDAHTTGTASSPIGTYSSYELVKVIKCT